MLDLKKEEAGIAHGILEQMERWGWLESRLTTCPTGPGRAPPRRYYRLTRECAARADAALAAAPEPAGSSAEP
jgi:hypothetical protein